MKPREWIGGRFQAPFYVEKGGPFRPELVLWMDATEGLILGSRVVHPSEPPEVLADCLVESIRQPMAGRPGKPHRIRVADSRYVECIRAVAGKDITIVTAPTPELDTIATLMAESLNEQGPHEALDDDLVERSYLEHGRIDPETVAGMFASARRLYQAAPWREMFDRQVLRLDVPALEVEGACISVIGALGENLGLVLFDSIDDYRVFIQHAMPFAEDGELPRSLGVRSLSLNFNSRKELSNLMLREVRKFGWTQPARGVYPTVMHADHDLVAAPIGKREVVLVTVAAEAVARFYSGHEGIFLNEKRCPVLEEFQFEAGGQSVGVRLTVPHTGVSWEEFYSDPDSDLDPDEDDMADVGGSERGGAAAGQARWVPVPGAPSPGAFDPCPCGSDRRYRKCCMPR